MSRALGAVAGFALISLLAVNAIYLNIILNRVQCTAQTYTHHDWAKLLEQSEYEK